MPRTIHLDRDIDALFDARQKLVRAGRECQAITAQFLFRPSSSTGSISPISYLPICPKRYIKRAHERHKLQRWIKEALRTSALLKQVESCLQEKGVEVLLGIRIDRMASATVNWKSITEDMQIMLGQLLQTAERYTGK